MLLSIVLIVAASFAVYGASLVNGFVDWDDPLLVLENPLIRNFSPRIFMSFDPELYIPVTLLSFQIEYALFGFFAFAFHLDSLLLHIINALLVLQTLLLLSKDRRLAVTGALLFAVHPLNVEAVAWVSARKELLATAFTLLSVIAYLRGSGGDRRWTALSIVAFALALLSKPVAILLPVLLIALDWTRGAVTRESVFAKWPYALLSLIAGLIAYAGKLDALSLLSPGEAVLLALRSAAFTLEKLFLPLHLSPIYAPPEALSILNPSIAISLIVVIALAAAAWQARRRMPRVTLGITWFFLFLLPGLLAYQKSDEVMLVSDRYAYLPSAGWALAVTAMIASVPHTRIRNFLFAGAAATACWFGVLTHAQSFIWRDTDTLFTHVLKVNPVSSIAFNNLGFSALSRGNVDEAIRLSSEAVRLKPTNADAHVNLGAAYGRKGDYDRAEQSLRRALEIVPRHAQAYFNLGGVEQLRGRYDAAALLYREAVAINPAHADAWFQLARAYVRLGRNADALNAYQSALNLNPQLRGVAKELDALQ